MRVECELHTLGWRFELVVSDFPSRERLTDSGSGFLLPELLHSARLDIALTDPSHLETPFPLLRPLVPWQPQVSVEQVQRRPRRSVSKESKLNAVCPDPSPRSYWRWPT